MSDDKPKLKENIIDIFKNLRIWILILFLFASVIAMNFTFDTQGAAIVGVVPGSVSEKVGIAFDSKANVRAFEKIEYINTQKINSPEDFYTVLSSVDSDFVSIVTDKNPIGYSIDISEKGNESIANYLGISVGDVSKSNIKLGIELEGGSRLILEPKDNLPDEEFDLLVNTLQNRLDVYGASGTKVNKIEDAFSDKKYVIVESVSANKNDIFELIKRQGKFSAVINNVTVFTGENVLRVDPSTDILEGCTNTGGGYTCTYAFSIEIDSDAGDNFYNVAKDLPIVNGRLGENIYFYLDGNEITDLTVASSFKYQKITSPQITVSGNEMLTQEAAVDSARKEMEFLQAILSTQSLPTELDIVQSYSISSTTGEKLLENALIVGILALLLVSSVVALRYRKIGVFIGIMIALFTEVIIVFGVAAFLRLSIDLAAIGGLIAAIGTGVDDQIIITDEFFRKRRKNLESRKKIKAAFYIIMIAYLTTLAAMVPLYFAGLNILQGFAFMIVVGITVGVFITRPAYGVILRTIMTTRKQRKDEDE